MQVNLDDEGEARLQEMLHKADSKDTESVVLEALHIYEFLLACKESNTKIFVGKTKDTAWECGLVVPGLML